MVELGNSENMNLVNFDEKANNLVLNSVYLPKSGEFKFYWRKHCLGFDCFIINLERGQRHPELLLMLYSAKQHFFRLAICGVIHITIHVGRLRPCTDSATDSTNSRTTKSMHVFMTGTEPELGCLQLLIFQSVH